MKRGYLSYNDMTIMFIILCSTNVDVTSKTCGLELPCCNVRVHFEFNVILLYWSHYFYLSLLIQNRNNMGNAVTKIEIKNLEFLEKIGEGGFGSVKRVTFKKPFKGYKEAAAKSILEIGKHEVEVMSQLNHKHIVNLLGVCQQEAAALIIMEYAPNGSLHDYLKDQSKPLPYKLQKKWAKEAALAIKYLHANKFLHRDIKPTKLPTL